MHSASSHKRSCERWRWPEPVTGPWTDGALLVSEPVACFFDDKRARCREPQIDPDDSGSGDEPGGPEHAQWLPKRDRTYEYGGAGSTLPHDNVHDPDRMARTGYSGMMDVSGPEIRHHMDVRAAANATQGRNLHHKHTLMLRHGDRWEYVAAAAALLPPKTKGAHMAALNNSQLDALALAHDLNKSAYPRRTKTAWVSKGHRVEALLRAGVEAAPFEMVCI